MPELMCRRGFLAGSSRAVLGSCLLPLVVRAQANPQAAELQDPAAWKNQTADLEKQLPGMMAEAKVPGLSIAIIHNARVRWRRGFGVKDKISKQPVVPETMFEAASMSKPVFAYAVMKLCEKGVLDLDTPLTGYTDERFIEGDPRLELITARHVLSHTSGFQNWRSDDEPLQIHFTPGEKFLYSGEGYSYLQSVVTRLTGQPIEPYMKANLFAPFAMTSTGYIWNGTFARRMARPHDSQGEPFDNKKSTPADVQRYGSSGALLTTASDYAKFLIEVIDPKKSDAFRLNASSLKEMLRPQVQLKDAYSTSWSLGWRITQTGKEELITHGGDNEGFHCWAVASVERKSGFVMMTNGENGAEFLFKLLTGDPINRFL